MEVPSKKDILNVIYQSIILSGVVVGYSYLLKRFLKMKICDPSASGIEEILKLSRVVSISSISVDYLYDIGIIPKNHIK